MTMKRQAAKQMHPIEHVRNRPQNYIGSVVPELINMWIFKDGAFVFSNVKVAPGFFKIIDEIIVNAIDQHVNNKEVNHIAIDLREDGSISVYNNGRGFDLSQKSTTIDGQSVWGPELCAGHMLTSTNYDDTVSRTTGGLNGIGMKATNIFSKRFELETQDGNLHFLQVFRDNLSSKDPPQVKKLKKAVHFTRITFLPDYTAFGHEFNPQFHDIVMRLIYTRAYQTAAFARVKVSCNDEPIKPISFKDFCKMHVADDTQVETIELREDADAEPRNFNHPIQVGFSLSPNRTPCSSLIVNGVSAYGGGTIIDHFRAQIIKGIKPQLTKMIEKRFGSADSVSALKNEKIAEFTFLYVIAVIDKPDFDSQSKALLKTDKVKFKNYVLPKSFLERCWNLLKDQLLEMLLASLNKKLTSGNPRRTLSIDNYEPARSKGDSSKKKLIIVEGLSAAGAVSNAISKSAVTGLSNEFYGLFPITGVPLNAMKKVSGGNGAAPAEDLQRVLENVRFSDLVQIIGFKADHHYELTPEGNAQFAKLRYGQLIVVTDQDLDGHNICGLCCANILSFWPALIKRGFLKKMNTPIIRVSLGAKKSKEFFSIQDYNDWSNDAPKHTAKYCKGLGSNNRDESISMFSSIDKKLIALAEDEKTFVNLHNYYGRDPEVRKRILIHRNSEKALLSTATLSEFLETNVHEYQRYNIARKIPSLYDGLTLAKRKALFAAIKELSDTSKEIKVIQLTGAVIKHSAYHHGDASMNETITKMAQTYPGAKILPPFLPEGQAGSFKKGGKDRASARYLFVQLNRQLTRLNYPKEDQYVLDYEFEEGERHEPKTYYTVIPNCIMEFIHIPATGWSAKVFPRDYKSVMDNLVRLLSDEELKEMPIYNYNGSKIGYTEGGQEFVSEADWKWNPQRGELHITRMPLYMFPGLHADQVGKKKEDNDVWYGNISYHAEKPNDTSDNGTTNLIYYMNKAGKEQVNKMTSNPDWALDFFRLRTYLKPNLNFIDEDGTVRSYNSYEAVMMDWFRGRKAIYERRLVRQRVVLKMQILRCENVIRFIANIKQFGNISELTEEALDAKLLNLGYTKFFDKMVTNPEFTDVKDIESECTGERANYKYLTTMSIVSLTKEKYQKYLAALADLKKQLAELEEDFEPGFVGRKTWLREVLELRKILDREIPRAWKVKK